MARDLLLRPMPKWLTPNGLTLVRLALTIPLLWCLIIGKRELAAIIFTIGAGTDALDGPLARSRGVAGVGYGKILDPLTDKFFFLAPLLWLVASGEYTAPIIAVFFALELCIASLGIAEFVRARGAATCRGANVFGKLKTGCVGICIGLLIAAPVITMPQWWCDVLVLFACLFGSANVALRGWMLRRVIVPVGS